MSLWIKQKVFCTVWAIHFSSVSPPLLFAFWHLAMGYGEPAWVVHLCFPPPFRPAEPGFFLHKQGRKSSQRTLLTFPQKLKRPGGRI